MFYRMMENLVRVLLLAHVSQHALAGVVEVYEGMESVLLPCVFDGNLPEVKFTVMWTRSDLSPRFVHQRGEEDDLEEQNQRYRGRTSMEPDALNSSHFSLSLRKPHLSDSSIYTCSINYGNRELTVMDVELKLKDHQEEVKVTEGAESVILPCRTTPDLPKDVRVEWSRSDPDFMMVHVYLSSKEIYCGRTSMKEHLLRSGDVSLTLKHPTDRDAGSYICTIYRNKDILRQKVVLIHVKAPFPSWATALLVLLVLVLIVSAGVLYYFRSYFMSVYKVEVESGVESVLLPCRTTVHLPGDARVEWKDGYHRTVHVYQNGSDQPKEQSQVYRTRTVMERKLLQPGDLSLTLKHPTDEDSWTFTCSVYNKEGNILMEKQVLLTFRDCQVEVEEGAESVLLPFKTTPDLPEDAMVMWRDSNYRMVHVYQNGSDQPGNQDQVYRTRTKMNQEPLKTGDLSLSLDHPKPGDSGRYRCRVWRGDHIMRYKEVQLKVKGTVRVQDQTEDIRTRNGTNDPLMADESV